MQTSTRNRSRLMMMMKKRFPPATRQPTAPGVRTGRPLPFLRGMPVAGALCLALAGGFLALPVNDARATNIIAVVNGEVVTSYQIDARREFLRATTGQSPSRNVILEQLIEEKLKISAARQNRVSPRPAEVNRQFAEIAKRNNMSIEYLERLLRRLGTSPQTMKDQILAEVSWRKAVRAAFAKKAHKYRADFAAEMRARINQGSNDATDYTLRPVIVVVPKKANDAAIAQRRRVAEAIAKSAASCDDAKNVARAYRDVVVRNPIIRSTQELGETLAEKVAATPVGNFTPAHRTSNGFVTYGVCKTRALKGQILPDLLQRTNFVDAKINDFAEDYLAELKEKAIIRRN